MKQLRAHFRPVFGPLNAYPDYRWGAHLLMVTPLVLVVLAIGFMDGWWGEPVRGIFTEVRLANPILATLLRAISNYSAPMLYGVYLSLLVYGIVIKQVSLRQLGCRYILFSLLITLLATQAIKYGLGMPRPDALWPPRPLGFFYAYSSFPSGHTTEIVASALPMALYFRKKPVYLLLALLVALVGYSRIWLGHHHPVDVLGGVVMGSVAARMIGCCPDVHSR